MPAARRDAFIDLDGYDRLCAEAEDGERLEYIDGQVFRMMVGGSTAHHDLTRRLDGLVAERLVPGGPCASFRETMRLEAGAARFYPDVFVSCGGPVAPDPETRGVASAVAILEVLSPSTERYDRGRKWLAYQTLPDLRHFVLVAQDQRRIEAYHREDAGWRYELLQAPDAVLRLDAIAVDLRLDEICAVIPMLATAGDDRPPPATFGPAHVTFGPAQVARIAGLKVSPSPPASTPSSPSWMPTNARRRSRSSSAWPARRRRSRGRRSCRRGCITGWTRPFARCRDTVSLRAT